MKITVFTSNQSRHLSLIESMASIADEVFAVQECTTVFPGRVPDFFQKSEVMQDYFSRVQDAEKKVFGETRFLPANVHQISLKMGDLSMVDQKVLEPALNSDYFVVFGASYIKGPLCALLVEKGALNIHMGISPYYRGSSCNFWALKDGNPQFVGATIHLLSKGLDSGEMLFHALPKAEAVDGFLLGMKAVKAAHQGLANFIKSGAPKTQKPEKQDKGKEIRYTRNADFNDAEAAAYLAKLPTPETIKKVLEKRDSDLSPFLRPFVL